MENKSIELQFEHYSDADIEGRSVFWLSSPFWMFQTLADLALQYNTSLTAGLPRMRTDIESRLLVGDGENNDSADADQHDVQVVIRGGVWCRVSADQLKLGDLVVLRVGDRVSFDGRMVDASVFLDWSDITGETEPIERSHQLHQLACQQQQQQQQQQHSMLPLGHKGVILDGSFVTAVRFPVDKKSPCVATALVCAVGEHTMMGEVNRRMRGRLRPPFNPGPKVNLQLSQCVLLMPNLALEKDAGNWVLADWYCPRSRLLQLRRAACVLASGMSWRGHALHQLVVACGGGPAAQSCSDAQHFVHTRSRWAHQLAKGDEVYTYARVRRDDAVTPLTVRMLADAETKRRMQTFMLVLKRVEVRLPTDVLWCILPQLVDAHRADPTRSLAMISAGQRQIAIIELRKVMRDDVVQLLESLKATFADVAIFRFSQTPQRSHVYGGGHCLIHADDEDHWQQRWDRGARQFFRCPTPRIGQFLRQDGMFQHVVYLIGSVADAQAMRAGTYGRGVYLFCIKGVCRDYDSAYCRRVCQAVLPDIRDICADSKGRCAIN